jgi:tRNA (guanine26-N2/guanine27-N2)-dimethyltransferase
MALTKIWEGKIDILVPEGEELTKKMSTFYNPEMKFDRDLSEIILSILKPKRVADCMCASGVRGLRYKSVLPDSEVMLNDLSPGSVELAKKNAKENNLEVKIENRDIHKFLGDYLFNFIDIDPFGSPVFFLDSAARSLKNDGYVAITATDTAALCGTSPNACLRKYGIRSLRNDFMKELGLRIMISSAIKTFSKYDMAFVPIFSYSRRHYFRAIGQVKRGAQKADALISEFRHISYCMKCGWRAYGIENTCKVCGGKTNIIEGVYSGDFASKEFCSQIIKKAGSEQAKFVTRIKEEQGFPPYYDVHKICEWNHKKIRATEDILKDLSGVRTHFLSTGIKTKKNFEEAINIL